MDNPARAESPRQARPTDTLREQIVRYDAERDPARRGEIARDISAEAVKLNTRMRERIAAMPDERERIRTEHALAETLRQLAPLLTERDRERLGRAAERETGARVARDDADPARQRLAAVREAGALRDGKAPERADRAQPPAHGDKTAAAARLEQADRDARRLFLERGMDPDRAMQRIRDGGAVDRQTRDHWIERDIARFAQRHDTTPEHARGVVLEAWRDAARLYSTARDEIRAIAERAPERKEARAPAPKREHSQPARARAESLDR